ncbi:MAG: RNA polymerase sigma factor [Archangium sp.]|nr:RNA polymerase sigma factor [Archangium sp.]
MTNAELGQLYERYGYHVHQRCLAILGQANDANDAMQDTFLRAQRYPPSGVESMLAWLCSVATRVCFDQLARNRRSEPWPERLLQRQRDARGGQDSSVELKLSLGAALLSLDETSREMAVMHLVEGLTQEEIAQRTGYSRRTVNTKLQAAGTQLRAALHPLAAEVTP